MSTPNVGFDIELKQGQFDYLSEMARKHGLPDESKALRCLVNLAMSDPDVESEAFTEVRCLDCGA